MSTSPTAEPLEPPLVLQGLNEPQRRAVLHGGGPLVVFAGAGSGKTRVITHRIAHLVAERRVPPWRILAVTFTNKAAAEMRARLEALVPGTASDLWVGTFHAICARLLRRYGPACGVRSDFVIYDDSDQKAMLTRVVRDLKLDERRYHPRMAAAFINRAKQEARGADDCEAADDFERVLRRIFEVYEERMLGSGALDFGDLIYRLVAGMRAEPSLREELQQRYSHVLVDEYQDTNRVQFLLVHMLCERHRNLMVVGDDDQSIYRWRGADRRNILDFTQHFADAALVKLEQNYRSTRRILSVANAVVGRNIDREPKVLWTENEEGGKVTVIGCGDERDEAAMVIRSMQFLLEAGSARNEIALLYRTHAQARVFEEALRWAELPYRVIGGVRFYDRAEVKDLLAYLRVVQNPDDDVSLLRVINNPPRGIGKTAVGRLLDSAARSGASVWRALTDVEKDPAQAPSARKRLVAFRGLIEVLQARAGEGAGPGALAEQILADTGYRDLLEDEDSAEADSRLENLREVLGSMLEFERDAEEPSLRAFLELVTLQTDVDRIQEDDAITLMTIHAAKGLEFPNVMVAGLEEGTFPHRGVEPGDDPEELEEERRLAYVAFTRAEQRLFLSYAQTRRVYGELRPRFPSRFLDEIPQSEVEWVGGARSRRFAGAGFKGTVRPSRAAPPSLPQVSKDPGYRDSYVDSSEASDHPARVERGMRVRHRKWGVGLVRAVTGDTPPRVTVDFPGWGQKTIVSTYLEPA